MDSLYLDRITAPSSSISSSKNQKVTFSEQPEVQADSKEEEIRCWIRYFHSAKKIQRIFRGWNARRRFRNFLVNSGYSNRRKAGLLNKVVSPTPTLSQCFRNIIQGKASFEHKTCLWRAVIELRRAYTVHSTDVILKALIEAKGDFQRAHCLLGVREFYEESKSPLSAKLRSLFLPSFTKPESDYNEAIRPVSLLDRNNTHSEYYYKQQGNSKSSNTTGRGVELIRALREKQRMLQKCELIDLLNESMRLSYFSTNHTGTLINHPNKIKLTKTPNSNSVRSSYQLQTLNSK